MGPGHPQALEAAEVRRRLDPAALRFDTTGRSCYRPDDLAVIRLEGERPPPAVFGDSSKLKVGEITFAVGNPLGLRSSVTQGMVSSGRADAERGTGRRRHRRRDPDERAHHPGNSGGAPVNLEGEAIGIPTLAATDPDQPSTATPCRPRTI
jgi:putative serine protease PepD